ncbi:MAG: OmpA family protein [Bacteroidales bacterium]|nr:OmpA family protein [Bacteroidales bacterium]
MKKIYLLTLIIIIFNTISFGQKDKNSETQTYRPMQVLKKAKTAHKSGDIFSAIDYYLIYDELKPNKPKVLSALGNLYLREKNYREAKVYLLKSYRTEPKKNFIDLFNYARCLHTLSDYENATKYFELFISETKRESDLKDYNRLAKDYIEGIASIPILKDSSLNVIISLLDNTVNKPHIEFSPIPYDDNKLIFASLPEKEIKFYDPEHDTLPTRKFYIAQRQGSNKWKNLGEWNKTINGDNINTGNGAFSDDKQRFYFSRCEKDFKHTMVCKLYVSELKNNEWQEPIALPEIINDPITSNTMPTIGLSRKSTDILYFVSDREGGRGGKDIWFTYYDPRKETWKEPKNCGRKINTILDEITPYYNIDTKTLYFSSEGHPGLGGFDIYKTFGEGKSFEGPKNVGYPINSSFDDLYYILEDSRQRGFFTSNRSGGYSLRHENCCDDIYEFIHKDFINIAVTGKVFGITDSLFFLSIKDEYIENLNIGLDILDKSDEIELLYDYPVNLYIVNGNKEYFVKTSLTTPGHYFFNLEQGKDYVISVKDVNKKDIRLPLTTKGITRSDTIVMDAIMVSTFPAQSLIVKNIYYEFAKSELTSVAKTTINNTIYEVLQSYPDIIIEISSHTDSIDTEAFNMQLSQDRAQSVVDYLINKGIGKERLVAKGYGKNQPIAPNSNPDGTDNPEGRQKNRRTEFKVLGQIDDDDELIYEDD